MQPTPTQPSSSPIPRPQKVTQLQCYDLDQQFKSIFSSSLTSAFKYFPDFINRFKAEFDLLLETIYWRFTVWANEPEPGNHLQNITYCTKELKPILRFQKVGLLVLEVVLPYIRKRLENVEWRWLQTLLSWLDTITKILTYVNLLLFIKSGKYRSVSQRLLSIQMCFLNPSQSRILDFSLMNRQLLWSIYQSFLSTVLPFLKRTLNSNIKKIFYLSSYMNIADEPMSCMVCNEADVVLPQRNNGCEHVACFYCMRAMMGGKERGRCGVCGAEFTGWGEGAGKGEDGEEQG